MMNEGDDFTELSEMLDDLQSQITALRSNEEMDRQLIGGLHACDLDAADVDRLARRLRPFVRAQVIRGALWRGQIAEGCGDLDWVPVWPIEVAVEVCAYGADEPVPDDLARQLAQGPPMDLQERIKIFRARGMAETSWRKDVERRLIQTAVGAPLCLETRKELDDIAASGELPQALRLVASERELRLVQPLWSLAHHYPILSDDEAFPHISDDWWQQRGSRPQDWT